MDLQGKFATIFTMDEVKRVRIVGDRDGISKLIIDVHGLSCREAKHFINNIINVSGIKCRVTIIHGYNHGSAIKTMINNQFENQHVYQKEMDLKNLGITHLYIA